MTSTPSPAPLADQLPALQQAYADLQARGLSLDLTRGKPSAEQLALSDPMLGLPGPGTTVDADGTDVRNYGGLEGLPQLRRIFAELLGVPVPQLMAGNGASLTVMYDVLVWALLHGTPDSPRPWSQEPSVKVLCGVPGYDRHFTLCERLGLEMVPVPMTPEGPDVDAAAALAADDPAVKAMWVVPTYANPDGSTVTREVAARLMAMPTAAPDFRVLWDNAYALHHLTDEAVVSADALGLAADAGHADRVLLFASTSKITFAGAGVSFFGASPANVAWYLHHLSGQTIGPDKVNHLRHALFLRDADGVRAHMARHRAIIAPKFTAVADVLAQRLGPHDVARWTHPRGGYFVTLEVVPGTAARVVDLAAGAGIALTPAGAPFPYRRDPEDRVIRLAPTFPPLEEVRAAMDGVATCVLLAAAEAAAGVSPAGR